MTMMLLLAILYAPFKILGIVLGFLVKHKILLLILVVVGLALLILNVTQSNKSQPTKELEYQTKAPDVKTAPYVIATTSRFYYVVNYTDDDKLITLKDYFSYDAEKWVRVKVPLVLDRSVFGDIRIYKR